MKKTLLIILLLSVHICFSQKIILDKEHITPIENVILSWDNIPVGSILDFDDGSPKFLINSSSGSISHIYNFTNVFYIKILFNKSILASKALQVYNCQLELYDSGAKGNFKLNYCDLINGGDCITPSISNNDNEYWSNQLFIQCFPLSADSFIMEMKLKLTRLPGSYLCLDAWLKIFGSNDFGIVHFFDNASCAQYYSFGAGSDNEKNTNNILKMNKPLADNWVILKLKKEGRKFTSYYNNVELASYFTDVKLGEVWGLNFASKGLTQLEYIRLTDLNNFTIYEENYNDCINMSLPYISFKIDSSNLYNNCIDSISYIALSTNQKCPNYYFQLDNIHTNNIGYFKNLSTGIHKIEMKNIFCDNFNKTLDFYVDSIKKSIFYYKFCEGDSILFNNKAYKKRGIFYDTILNNHNCKNEFSIINIEYKTCDSSTCNIQFPNIFSPNGDSINDFFEPISNMSNIINLTIFDRWGKIVFSELSKTPKWNGKINGDDALQDIYTYTVDYKCNNIDFRKIGEIILLR